MAAETWTAKESDAFLHKEMGRAISDANSTAFECQVPPCLDIDTRDWAVIYYSQVCTNEMHELHAMVKKRIIPRSVASNLQKWTCREVTDDYGDLQLNIDGIASSETQQFRIGE